MKLKSTAQRIAFLDRDGILNPNAPNHEYVCSAEHFELLPEVVPFLRQLEKLDFQFILITNQQGIGKGLMTVEDLAAIHGRMSHLLTQNGLKLLDIYYCPHLAADGCDCRKPAPGMLFKAQSDHNVNLSEAIFVGDSLTDAQAGQAAGVRTFVLIGAAPLPAQLYGAVPVRDLNEIITRLSP